jgi:hypothetical protein
MATVTTPTASSRWQRRARMSSDFTSLNPRN